MGVTRFMASLTSLFFGIIVLFILIYFILDQSFLDEQLNEQFRKIIKNTIEDASYQNNEVVRQNHQLIHLLTNQRSGNYYPLLNNTSEQPISIYEVLI